MSKKRLVLIVLGLVLVFSLSGCLDLLSVPGVAVSPDGSRVYFLGTTATGSEDTAFPFTVVSGGTATVIGDAIGAFAVNPISGEVAYNAVDATNETTSIMVVDASGNSRVLVAPEAMPGLLIATEMAYSPDGNWVAMTAVNIPPEVDLDSLDSEETPPAEVLAQIKSAVYVIDSAGAVTPLSDVNTMWANNLDWSPDGQHIAFNAWMDTDGDGIINTMGGLSGLTTGDMSGAGDQSHIHIFSVADGSTTQVTTTTTDYDPNFISNTQVAYLSADFAMMMVGTGLSINVYDLGSGSSSSVYQSTGSIAGMDVSQDFTQVAWVEMPSDAMTGATEEGSESAPANLYVSDTTFASPRMVTQIPNEFGLIDAPVWMPDGSGVLITSTSFFASFLSSMTASFGDFSTELGGTPEAALEEIPVQNITLVNVSDGSTTVLYEGGMTNSSFLASIFSMSAMDTSGLLESE